MYSRILVPVDGSKTSGRALQEAIGVAKLAKSQLIVLNVIDDFPMMIEMSSAQNFDTVRRQLRMQGEEVVEKAKALVAAQGIEVDAQVVDITQGRVAGAILKAVDSTRCDLVVMGTHGRRGVSHLMMGSDAEAVVRQCKVPVLVVRQPEGK